MGNIFNDDFSDFIRALNTNDVEYLLVGGMAVILYGYIRITGDIDLWVKNTDINFKKIRKAFHDFHMPSLT